MGKICILNYMPLFNKWQNISYLFLKTCTEGLLNWHSTLPILIVLQVYTNTTLVPEFWFFHYKNGLDPIFSKKKCHWAHFYPFWKLLKYATVYKNFFLNLDFSFWEEELFSLLFSWLVAIPLEDFLFFWLLFVQPFMAKNTF